MSIIYIYFMHLSSDNCVDVDACRMSYYEMWFYDDTCDGGRILKKKGNKISDLRNM